MKNIHETIAKAILDAYKTNSVIPPFSETHNFSLEDAYTIQNMLYDHWIRQGDHPIGKKMAFANLTSQKAQGLGGPAFATIFASGLLDSNQPISIKNLPHAVIEAEITFLLKDDLKGPSITPAHVIAATEAVFPSFEIVSCRVENSPCGLDKIAANVCFGGLILGSKGVSPINLDLKTLGVVLEKNGVVSSSATGAAALGNPANSVAWLANALIAKGQYLKKGDLVLSGCIPAAQSIAPGDVFYAHFEHLGSISATFVK